MGVGGGTVVSWYHITHSQSTDNRAHTCVVGGRELDLSVLVFVSPDDEAVNSVNHGAYEISGDGVCYRQHCEVVRWEETDGRALLCG